MTILRCHCLAWPPSRLKARHEEETRSHLICPTQKKEGFYIHKALQWEWFVSIILQDKSTYIRPLKLIWSWHLWKRSLIFFIYRSHIYMQISWWRPFTKVYIKINVRLHQETKRNGLKLQCYNSWIVAICVNNRIEPNILLIIAIHLNGLTVVC